MSNKIHNKKTKIKYEIRNFIYLLLRVCRKHEPETGERTIIPTLRSSLIKQLNPR